MRLRTVALLALTAIFACLKTPSNEGRTITALLLCVVASALAVALVYAEIAAHIPFGDGPSVSFDVGAVVGLFWSLGACSVQRLLGP